MLKRNQSKNRLQNRSFYKGQAIIEFTFSMVIVFLMIYGVMKVFQWTGLDLANRRIAHESLLVGDVLQDYSACQGYQSVVNSVTNEIYQECVDFNRGEEAAGPLKQIDSFFHMPTSMN
ncbi:MAG: hypothetical protein KC713_06670, partial [Candidatus Omnitrophica bacterium]|nr:hypothetical protein [Candidatus Omnitrophota bacterium]